MAAFSSTKIQLFGHSFVRRLRQHILRSTSLNFYLDLQGPPLIQYSEYPGATVASLRDKLEDVSDFSPDILVLEIGTNDIYSPNETPETVANHVLDLVDTLLYVVGVPKVIVFQTLHRQRALTVTKYPVNCEWFNERVDNLNAILLDKLNPASIKRAYFWKLKGFWSAECKERNFASDGCHLSNEGQLKYICNIRAAVVAALKKSI